MKQQEFAVLRDLLFEWTGIHLNDGKKGLMEARLQKCLAGMDVEQYWKSLHADSVARRNFINALTTNKTEWFREQEHFSYLQRLIADSKRSSPLMVWSAACSTGEEPYSLAILLNETLGSPQAFRVLGSDIDSRVLAQAERGVYESETVVHRVPPHLASRYFRPSSDRMLSVSPEIRPSLKFRSFNLIQDEWPAGLAFDVIFLRNVLIYFQRETISHVISRLKTYLRPGAYLFVGCAETLNGVSHGLEPLGHSVYRKTV